MPSEIKFFEGISYVKKLMVLFIGFDVFVIICFELIPYK